MRNVMIIGAGRLGKGYFGEVFDAAGWHVTFVDSDARVIEELRVQQEVRVTVLTTDEILDRRLKDYDALLLSDSEEVGLALRQTDVVMLPLYPEDFPSAAVSLAPALAAVAHEQPGHQLTFICVTNKNHIIDVIEKTFVEALPDEQTREWFRSRVVVRDSIVRRATDAEAAWSTSLVSTAVAPLLIQGPLNHDISEVEWLDLRDNIEVLKDVKIFTINSAHAATAYAGAARGHQTIPQAAGDPVVADLARRVKASIDEAILLEYDVTQDELRDLEYLPKAKHEIADSIRRVAYDPIRKLGPHDRFVGASRICRAHGIDDDPIAEAMAYAMLYSEPTDAASMRLQDLRASVGDHRTLAEVTSLAEDHPLIAATLVHLRDIGRPG